MERFAWEPAFDVHVDAMNDQHRQLIDRMNQVHALHLAGAPRDQVAGVLDGLIAFALAHFEEEERFMASIGFAGIGLHRTVHRQLRDRLEEHVIAFRETGQLTEEFFDFLWRWLAAHIVGIDAKYGEAARAAA